MVQPLNYLKESPSQTAGPYVHIGCAPNFVGNTGIYPEDLGIRMVNADTKGERITIKGQVLDGNGTPLKDALIEIWQPDADGFFNSPEETRGQADPNFTGWGRSPGDFENGEFTFETIKPGRVPAWNGKLSAPFISVLVLARGVNIGLQTRMYFPEDAALNAEDPVLNRIEHRSRVDTLVAKKLDDGTYRFDIRIQGEGETVFFDI
ncbi:protocatechuate 3,4-dioxygenase subunit alpha [Rhodovulum sp. DZ06]|uniref:protocatechuate 3,4-dioxygenase subunit alpha n=1 Tax=Rhodovulum sp. DZ06 TaxID=3425126 RepID=UPI003D335857